MKTSSQLADFLRLNLSTVRGHMTSGKVPGQRLGRYWYVDEEDERVKAYIAKYMSKRDFLPSQPLTEREQEVYVLLSQDSTDKQLAELLQISLPTVRFHLGNIYRKIGVRNRTEAIARKEFRSYQ